MKIALRILLVMLAVSLVTAGIIAAWYALENHRGARDWADTRRNLEARGEKFDAASFIPGPVPDDQNFALAPFFERIYHYRVDPVTGLLTFGPSFDPIEGLEIATDLRGVRVQFGPGWQAGQAINLANFQKVYRSHKDFPRASSPQAPAADVLLALSRFDSLFDELARTAASRPFSRFPVNWTQRPVINIRLPHDILIDELVILLSIRASASLAAGQPEPAYRDILLGFRLRSAISQEPTIIANLIGVMSCGLLMQPIWDGLAARQWSAAQLGEFQAELSDMDVLRDYRYALQSERSLFLLPLVDDTREAKDLNDVMPSVVSDLAKDRMPKYMSLINRVLPRGFYDASKAMVSRLDQQYGIDNVDAVHHRMDARKIDEGYAFASNLQMTPTTYVPTLCLPVVFGAAAKMAHGQAFIDEAIVACALERFYLDHQSYPPNLPALVPAYLARVPTDVIDGAPLRYQLTSYGRYRLWEVGWNGRDENGTVAWQTNNPWIDQRQGDWVWQYEASFPPPPHLKK